MIEEHKIASFVFFGSDTPDVLDSWKPVLPADLPAWVKKPDVLGNLVADPTYCVVDKDFGPTHYRAVAAASNVLMPNAIREATPKIVLPGLH